MLMYMTDLWKIWQYMNCAVLRRRDANLLCSVNTHRPQPSTSQPIYTTRIWQSQLVINTKLVALSLPKNLRVTGRVYDITSRHSVRFSETPLMAFHVHNSMSTTRWFQLISICPQLDKSGTPKKSLNVDLRSHKNSLKFQFLADKLHLRDYESQETQLKKSYLHLRAQMNFSGWKSPREVHVS